MNEGQFHGKSERQRPPIQEAVYHASAGNEFAGNPLVEALPDYLRFDNRKRQQALARMPQPPPKEATRVQRSLWLLSAASDFFVAIGRHVVLFEWIDRAIRVGYKFRNPLGSLNPGYLAEAYRRQQSGEIDFVRYGDDHLGSFMLSLIGSSGTGKSLAVEEVLKFYPQVIRHSHLRNMDSFDQVVHLKVECPPNGSLKSLCKDIIDELDRVTGLEYDRIYRTDRATESDLKKAVAQTFALHRVGLLVIDEIQNLTASRKNKDELFNFIVSLSNALDVPVLNVGTPQVKELLGSTMRVARRFGLWGKYDWGTLETNGTEWDDFFDKVKQLYALKEPFDEVAVKNALYYYSQGIPGILVNMFLLSQMRAMVERKETLTAEIIDRTDALYFSQLHAMVKALRDKDKKALAKYPDMGFTDEDFQLAGAKLTTEIEINSSPGSLESASREEKRLENSCVDDDISNGNSRINEEGDASRAGDIKVSDKNDVVSKPATGSNASKPGNKKHVAAKPRSIKNDRTVKNDRTAKGSQSGKTNRSSKKSKAPGSSGANTGS